MRPALCVSDQEGNTHCHGHSRGAFGYFRARASGNQTRVKGFASRGFTPRPQWMLLQVVPQLSLQEPPPAATLQIPFAPQSNLLLQGRFVIDQAPRPAIGGRKRSPLLVLRHPPPQIRGETNVESVIRFRLENVNVKHESTLSQNRVRRSLLRDLQPPPQVCRKADV